MFKQNFFQMKIGNTYYFVDLANIPLTDLLHKNEKLLQNIEKYKEAQLVQEIIS